MGFGADQGEQKPKVSVKIRNRRKLLKTWVRPISNRKLLRAFCTPIVVAGAHFWA